MIYTTSTAIGLVAPFESHLVIAATTADARAAGLLAGPSVPPAAAAVQTLISLEHPVAAPTLTIAPAVSTEQREAAAALIAQRYSWRGYQTRSLPPLDDHRLITLVASVGDCVVGTITVGLDGPSGLSCEKAFADQVDKLRSEGRRICEFTRLAVSAEVSGSQVPAALFLAGFVVADQLKGCDTLLLEVNPRHQRFYKRVFGAEQLGEPRHHHGVDAPAVLMALVAAPLTRHLERTWTASVAQGDATASAPQPGHAPGPMLGRHYACYADAMTSIDAHAMLAQLQAARGSLEEVIAA